MKKQIIVTDIKWDAPKSANLPKEVVIDINKENEYLLDDIDGYADNLSDYLSDTYEYCHEGFSVECSGVKEELNTTRENLWVCDHCLMAIESREGNQATLRHSVDETDAVDSRCSWCGDVGFDTLYELI